MPPKKEAEQRGLGHFFKVLTVATAAAPPAEPGGHLALGRQGAQ